MISQISLKPNNISFKADENAIGGAAFAPRREIKSMEAHHSSPDKVLRYNMFQNLALAAKKVTYDIPGSIVRGLQGDRSVSFNEFLQMAALPYYLGGGMLFNCFKQGGDIKTAKQQGVGIVLYYAGMGLANNFVDSFVKHKFGVDLNLKYKNIDGETRKVFESVDFTRWDLLTEKDWNEMGDKLGIPVDVPDRDTAIIAEVNKILVRARAWKLALGATFAATGVGLAKNETWKNLFTDNKAIATSFKGIFSNPQSKALASRVREFKTQLVSTFKSDIVNRFATSIKDLPKSHLGKVPVGKIAIAAVIGLPIIALLNLIFSPSKGKTYLNKAEAMPHATKIENDPALKEQLTNQINPNKVDYEELYTQFAKNVSQGNQTAQVQNNNQIAQVTSPFDAFEAFMKRGV